MGNCSSNIEVYYMIIDNRMYVNRKGLIFEISMF